MPLLHFARTMRLRTKPVLLGATLAVVVLELGSFLELGSDHENCLGTKPVSPFTRSFSSLRSIFQPRFLPLRFRQPAVGAAPSRHHPLAPVLIGAAFESPHCLINERFAPYGNAFRPAVSRRQPSSAIICSIEQR